MRPKHLVPSCLLVSLLALGVPALALDAPPLYERISIAGLINDIYPTSGISSATALNEDGDTVGYVIIDNQYHAFIYTASFGVQLLPPLPGWTSHLAFDVTNPDPQGHVVIVGDARASIYSDPGRAAAWIYDVSTGSVVETIDIGILEGAAQSTATGVNDAGVVVGYSWPAGYRPMVFDLGDRVLHEVDLPFAPADINNGNRVAGSSGRATLVKDPGSGEFSVTDVEDLGSPPNTSLLGIAAINEQGHVVGTTAMSYTDGAGHRVKGAVRYTDAWEIVWANSWQDSGTGINESGDVVGTLGVSAAFRAALYIDALDEVFLVEDLQDPWGFLDSARDINDAGWIAGGSAGAVLLVRLGDMPPPTAPANLTAVPHEPTWQQPWNAITLNWEDASTLTQGFYVERRVSGTADWVEIVSDWSNTQLWDTTVELGVTYDYRVRAKGIGGFSEYSNIATATAPSDPVDTEPPIVVFVTPQDGETVIGDVQIVVDVTDNRALNYIEVTAAGQTICSEALGGTTSSTTLDCTWNTTGLPTAWYTIYAYASDAMTSATTESIQVYVQGTGLCDGDGVCTLGEDCLSCPGDCAGQTTGNPDDRWCCGDGTCSAAEDGTVCPLDCCTAPPDEVSGVGFDADEVTVYWTPSAPDDVYDVARQNFSGVGTGEALECLVTGLETASYSDQEEPAAHALFCYLVRASNACGAGGWGTASGGEPRTAPCP